MKGILVIADGLGGRPTDYKGKTCLQAARTPNLDKLAGRGSTGLLDPVRPGVRPGSDVAHLSLFGYDPYIEYPGRGVFEAAGVGLEVRPGDICFRTNFATVDQEFVVQDRRAGRISSGQKDLELALSELKSKLHPEIEVLFKTSTEHRGALILRGPDLSPNVTEADPHDEGVKVLEVETFVDTLEENRTAEILNEIIQQSFEILKDHSVNKLRSENGDYPANLILPRGASIMPHLESFNSRYGISGSVIAGGALYIGIGKILGLEYVPVEGATGRLDSNVKNKLDAAANELSHKDFVFVHMKGPDSAGHDKNAEAKIEFIEKIDEAMGHLTKSLNWNETHLAFTGDHCTPTDYGDHTGEPVPLFVVGPNVVQDKVDIFCEFSAQEGGLARFSGNVVPMLASYCNWLRKFGS
jgi:2,3-bisphosphoglycerate-independent phosphoglycerate mutase